MKSRLLNILYNSGSVQTCEDHSNSAHMHTYNPHLEENDNLSLQKLEDLMIADSLNDIATKQESFHRQLQRGLNSKLRTLILQEYNLFLIRTHMNHHNDIMLFDQCLHVILEFKRQIDADTSEHVTLSQMEWIELEKAIYFLSEWENKLHVKSPVAITDMTAKTIQ